MVLLGWCKSRAVTEMLFAPRLLLFFNENNNPRSSEIPPLITALQMMHLDARLEVI